MAKIPQLRSPHDDSALNIHNTVIDTVNNIGGIKDDIEDVALTYTALLNNSLAQYQRDSVKLVFELGGWLISGVKVTGENPVNLRSVTPYYLRKGMVISQRSSDVYNYSFIIRSSDIERGDYFLDHIKGIEFGKDSEVTSGNYYYLVIDRKDGAVMQQSDVTAVNELFNEVYLDYNLLIDLDLTHSLFELGGWLISGVKVTGDNPINLRSKKRHFINTDTTIKSKASTVYNYKVLEYSLEDQFVSDTGFKPFGTDTKLNLNKYYRLVIERADKSPMKQTDLDAMEDLFLGFVSTPSGGSFKEISKFSLVGDLSPYNSADLANYIPNPNDITPQSFHNLMIALVNSNSDIASHKLLGKDGYNNNLYKYETNPHVMRKSTSWNIVPTGTMGTPLEIPKIIITSGVHGREKNSNYVLYYFMKALLENPNNDPVIETLLTNVKFVFVPMICPSGFIDVTYENRAGVNLNRDFPSHGNASQPETKLVKAVIDEHSDADYHIDFHNQTAHDSVIGYALTDDESIARVATNAYKYIGRQWQIKNSDFPTDRKYQWGYTAAANVGTVGRYSNEMHGIPSSIIETPVNHGFISEVPNGRNVTQIGVDLLANVIIGLLQARR